MPGPGKCPVPANCEPAPGKCPVPAPGNCEPPPAAGKCPDPPGLGTPGWRPEPGAGWRPEPGPGKPPEPGPAKDPEAWLAGKRPLPSLRPCAWGLPQRGHAAPPLIARKGILHCPHTRPRPSTSVRNTPNRLGSSQRFWTRSWARVQSCPWRRRWSRSSSSCWRWPCSTTRCSRSSCPQSCSRTLSISGHPNPVRSMAGAPPAHKASARRGPDNDAPRHLAGANRPRCSSRAWASCAR